MSPPRLLCIILNYRTPGHTLSALSALIAEMRGLDGAITVVDNDSGDGSFARIRAAVAEGDGAEDVPLRLLQAGRNGGFGAGNNLAIRAGLPGGGRPDYIYILNPDAMPRPGALHRLLAHLQRHPRTGLAGSRIHGPDGSLHRTVFRFPSWLGEFEAAARIGPVSRLLARHVIAAPVPEATGPVDWLAGASLMMRRRMLDEIGLFDEGYFLYFEETDLCLRAARAGWRTDFVRDSVVTHVGGAATGMKRWQRVPRYWFDSRLRYFHKNHGAAHAALATLAHLSGGALHHARRQLAGRPPEPPARLLRDMAAHALGHAWQHLLPGPPHRGGERGPEQRRNA